MGLYRGYIGIIQKKNQTTIYGLGLELLRLSKFENPE